MNVSKIVAHQTSGADQNTLLTVIHSRLDYGAIVYGGARKHTSKLELGRLSDTDTAVF